MPTDKAIQEHQEEKHQSRAGRSHHSPLERVTVNLTARASRALDRASQLTGDSKTDTINRALQIYAYLEEVSENGGTIYIKESPEAQPQIVKMF